MDKCWAISEDRSTGEKFACDKDKGHDQPHSGQTVKGRKIKTVSWNGPDGLSSFSNEPNTSIPYKTLTD